MSRTRHIRDRKRQHFELGKTLRQRPIRPAMEPEATGARVEREEPIVTDHAIVRWMERVVGIDVRAKVEADILSEGRKALIRKVGQGRIRVPGVDAVLLIRDGRVVSVLDA